MYGVQDQLTGKFLQNRRGYQGLEEDFGFEPRTWQKPQWAQSALEHADRQYGDTVELKVVPIYLSLKKPAVRVRHRVGSKRGNSVTPFELMLLHMGLAHQHANTGTRPQGKRRNE